MTAAGEPMDRGSLERGWALVEGAPDAFVIVDARGFIQFVNAQTERMFGYARAELVGKPIDVLLPERFRDRHAAHLKAFFSAPRARPMGAGLDLSGARKDGSEFPVEIALSPMSTPEGPIVTAAIRDVTDRKRAEEVRLKNLELEIENRRIREASRLKSEFLAHMSHELRTPLNAIIGFAEVLSDGQVDPSSPKFKEFLGDILASGRHLMRLINDVLDLSKVEAGRMEFRPERVDVRKVIEEVCSIVRTVAAEKQMRVEIDCEQGLDATVDPARLKQVLYNYLSNALKFTPQGGRVVVRAGASGLERFRIEVEDSGIGIPVEDIPSLFVEFGQVGARAEGAPGGTGLGLALTKRLVEAQGGSVNVRSAAGKGSVFSAELPRHSEPQAPVSEKTTFPARRPNARSVLVVEDDPFDRALLVDALTGAGYAVETVASGVGALARAHARAFDALTLDILLPDMSGLDVLASLRAEGASRDAVVILVTVVAEPRAAAGFAVHDIISKPLKTGELLESLRRAGIEPDRQEGVLVVDDDPSALKLAGLALERIGYRAICTSSGEAGLAAAAESHPLAVVLDLLMPGMNGFEFLDRFRALPEHRATPVIIWTIKDLTNDEHQRLRSSAQAIVHKKIGGTSSLVAELNAFLLARDASRNQ